MARVSKPMSDPIRHYDSVEEWASQVLAGDPPHHEQNIAHDRRVLDTKEKVLAYLEEIGALTTQGRSAA